MQHGHHEGGIAGRERIEERVADDRDRIPDLRHGLEHGFDLPDHLAGAGNRGTVGQLNLNEKGALVFLGQEARGRHARDAADPDPKCND